jgi:hypothetical protein
VSLAALRARVRRLDGARRGAEMPALPVQERESA